MKYLSFISILLAVCLSTSVCYARRKRGKDGIEDRRGKGYNRKTSVYATPDVANKVIDDSEELDENSNGVTDSLEDIDSETETLMNVLDMAEDIIEKKHGKGRKRGRGKQWKGKCVDVEEKVEAICSKVAAAKENLMLENILKKYESTNRQAEWTLCCSQQKQEDRLACFKKHKMEQLDEKCSARPRGFMKKCCKETGEKRMNCFVNMKRKDCTVTSEPPKPTSAPRRPDLPTTYSDDCCYKLESPNKNESTLAQCSAAFEELAKEGSACRVRSCTNRFIRCCIGDKNKTDIRTLKRRIDSILQKYYPMDEETEVYKPRKSNREKILGLEVDARTHKMIPGRKTFKMAKLCCNAGQNSLQDTDSKSEEVCTNSYNSWAMQTEKRSYLCQGKYIWCCMNREPTICKRRSSNVQVAPSTLNVKIEPETNVNVNITEESLEIPDETGQELEVTMTMPTYNLTFIKDDLECCRDGKLASIGGQGLEGTLQCYSRQQELMEKHPEYPTTCFVSYLTCCTTSLLKDERVRAPSKSTIVSTDKPSEEETTAKTIRKISRGFDPYRGKDGELPDGLKQAPNGHFYYVDKISPDLADGKRRTLKIPPKAL